MKLTWPWRRHRTGAAPAAPRAPKPLRETRVRGADAEFLSQVRAAQQLDATPGANAALYLMLLVLVLAIAWASVAQVDMVTKAEARVVPAGREQVIASLEGGILRELHVREGSRVYRGQELAQLDPTRFEAQQNEGEAKRIALRGTVARLSAEAGDRPLEFPEDVADHPEVVTGEMEAYEARRRALDDALASTRRSVELLQRELRVAQAMSAKGLMSDVEVMRLQRQVNDLQLQGQERANRYRQEASTELLRVQSELAQLTEQMVVREDLLRRTALTSPVDGMVKNIRVNTVGGIVTAGAPIMEIVPIGDPVMVEARLRPADIGFVRVGHAAEVKLMAYEYTVYGGLQGRVDYISPDALGEPDKAGGRDSTWYRVLVKADGSTLRARNGEPLPVLPGMTAMVEVQTGKRSVLSFLLRPMLKSQEAFRER